MRSDWVPVSAAALLTGAMALTFGSLIMPSTGGSTDTLMIVQQEGGRWMAVASIYFLASVALTLGLPSALTLFDRRGRQLSLVSAVVLAVGFLGTAGYAMLMVFFHSLVVTGAIKDQGIEDLAHETGLAIFLYGWIVAFFLGETLFAIALLRARTAPTWVPVPVWSRTTTALLNGFASMTT